MRLAFGTCAASRVSNVSDRISMTSTVGDGTAVSVAFGAAVGEAVGIGSAVGEGVGEAVQPLIIKAAVVAMASTIGKLFILWSSLATANSTTRSGAKVRSELNARLENCGT